MLGHGHAMRRRLGSGGRGRSARMCPRQSPRAVRRRACHSGAIAREKEPTVLPGRKAGPWPRGHDGNRGRRTASGESEGPAAVVGASPSRGTQGAITEDRPYTCPASGRVSLRPVSRSARTAPAGPISPPPGISIRRRPATPELALGPGISRSGRFGVSPGFTGSRQVAAHQTLMGPKGQIPGLPGRSLGSHKLLISGELCWSRRADSNRGPADYE